jgi:type VI secretion system protein ImpA
MSTPIYPVDVDVVMAPAAGGAPSGPDLRYDPIFDEIKNLRKLAEAEPANINPWKKVADLVVSSLTRSKDLQLGIWLTESLARIDGFRGTATGLVILRRMLVEFWDSLYPPIDPEDSDPFAFRISLLEWIGHPEKLSAVIKTAPITAPPASYGLLHYDVTQKSGDEKKALIEEGWPSNERFEEALQNSSLKFLEDVLEQVMTSEAELAALQEVAEQRLNPDGKREGVSFTGLKKTLETGHWLVERPIKKAREAAGQAAGAAQTTAADGTIVSAGLNGDQLWNEALTLTRGSRLDGLRLLQAQVAAALCGRDRFLRQLQLGELCLEAGVHALAFPIFDDLARIIETRQLVEWEDKTLISRAWSGFIRCSRLLDGQAAANVTRAQELLDRLTQLDPSQAGRL